MSEHKQYDFESLKDLFDAAPCGATVYDAASSETLYVNDAFLALTGYTAEQYLNEIGGDYRRLILPADTVLLEESRRLFIKEGKTAGKFRIMRRDGAVRFLSASVSRISAEGRDAVLCLIGNVDEREGDTAQRAYNASSEGKKSDIESKTASERRRYQLVTDEMNAAVFEWNLRTSSYYSSESYKEYAMSTVPRRLIFTNNGPEDIIHPDDRETLSHFFDDMKKGSSRACATVRMKLVTGGYRWCRMIARFFRDEDKQLALVLGIIIDVSEEKEKSFMLDNLLNRLPGGVAIFKSSEKQECSYFNDGYAALLGEDRETLQDYADKNELFEHFVYPPDLPRCIETIHTQSARRLPINFTYRVVKKDGSIQWLTVSANIIRYEDDCPVYYSVYVVPPEETALYQSIVEDSTTAVLAAERATRRVLYVNDTLKKIYGLLDEKTLTGKCIFDYVQESELLLDRKEVYSLVVGEYSEFHKEYKGKYYHIRAKALIWNGADSYMLYINDETEEHEKNLMQQRLLNSVPAGIGIYRFSNGKLEQIYMNDTYYDMVGENREERRQKTKNGFMELVYKPDIPAVTAMVEDILGGMDTGHADHRVLCGDGQYRWFRIIASVVQRDAEEVTAYCSYLDYDEIMMAKQTQEQANDILRRQYAAEQSQRKLLEENSAAVILFNVTRDELSEYRKTSPLFPKYQDGISGGQLKEELMNRIPETEDRDRVTEFFDLNRHVELYERGITERRIEFLIRQNDGCLHWLNVRSRLMKAENDDIISYVFITDISREKKNELAISSVVDDETDLIILLSTVKKTITVLRLNDEQKKAGHRLFSEIPYELALRADNFNNVDSSDRDAVLSFLNLENIVSKLNDGTEETIGFVCYDGEGQPRRKKLQATYLNKYREDIVVSSKDVTDIFEEEKEQKRKLRSALDAAEVASRAKSEFLSNMSHEIRTPMNAILGMTQIALEEVGDRPATVQNLLNIKRSSDYLLSILNDILDMSRIESGRFTLCCKWASPEEIIYPCIDMMRPMMEAKNITFTTPSLEEEKDREYYVDVVKTQRMIMNILNNACKFTGRGGHVEMKIRSICRDKSGSTDIITVEDDGCGMSNEFLTHIFSPFAQERTVYTDSTQGTGLGLALARQTARAMGGDITVESRLGVGSRFSIIFPYKYRLKRVAGASDVPIEGKLASYLNGRRILLCEDNKINTVIAKKLLEKAGCTVDAVENGKLGFDTFSASEIGCYDAVLMDIRMPVMDGLQAAKAIRALNRADAKTIPIIAMSANAFDEDEKTSLAAGMNAHLAKPVDARKLYETLSEHIAANKKD